MDPAIVLFGLGVGVLVGTTGMGGGSLDAFLIISIAGALLLTGALVLLRALVLTGSGERAELELETRHKVAAVALGASIGFVLGVTSAGTLKLRHPEVKPA